MAKQYVITLVKSLSGRHDKHIATANSLGLRRIGDISVQPDNPQTLGKLHQIRYLVKAAEFEKAELVKTKPAEKEPVKAKAEVNSSGQEGENLETETRRAVPKEGKPAGQKAAKPLKDKAVGSNKQEVRE